jgi:hypothetical protein
MWDLAAHGGYGSPDEVEAEIRDAARKLSALPGAPGEQQ